MSRAFHPKQGRTTGPLPPILPLMVILTVGAALLTASKFPSPSKCIYYHIIHLYVVGIVERRLEEFTFIHFYVNFGRFDKIS
jgi:hypothetical protein